METVAFIMVLFGLCMLFDNTVLALVILAAGFLTYDVDRYMKCQPTKVQIEYGQWFHQTCAKSFDEEHPNGEDGEPGVIFE